MSSSENNDQGEVTDEIDVVSMEDGVKSSTIEETPAAGEDEAQEKNPSSNIAKDNTPESTKSCETDNPKESSGADTSIPATAPTTDSEIDTSPQCYCQKPKSGAMFYCDTCKKYFHPGCLKNGNPTTLEGDIFFKFVCENCSSTSQETMERIKMTWQQVVVLCLYNLSLHKSGRKGYFRWKEDICEFISNHWILIFGQNKSKTQTWHGTVAGVLSVANKVLFRSGAQEFGESGWWCLIENKPPTLRPELTGLAASRANLVRKPKIAFEPTIKLEGLRNRKRGTSCESAIELKEKRSRTQEAKEIRKAKQQSEEQSKRKAQKDILGDNLDESSLDSFPGSECLGLPPSVPDSPSVLSLLGGDNSSDSLLTSLLNERDLTPADTLPMALMAGDEEDVMMPSKGVSLLCTPTPQMSSSQSSDSSLEKELLDNESGITNMDTGEAIVSPTAAAEVVTKVVSRARKSKVAEAVSEVMGSKGPKYLPMSIYEERQLLRIVESCSQAVDCDPAARRFRRKLLVRQEKRERGLRTFDLDASLQSSIQCRANITPSFAANLLATRSPLRQAHGRGMVGSWGPGGDYRILDRFQMPQFSVHAHQRPHSFRSRLVGCSEDMMMQSIISPYTARILKPFIRRDTESKPLKLRLMQEILTHPKRLDPTFVPLPPAPVDYCYVRPQHIPSVNSLCREFFWPGIDLSECLQYPDFSVVALYRKVVIGFGFMVPDVKYNEAYISFLFVHPEWRNAGIATFMVYHLIQTCMGKDVTLHVDATNSAMLLYQKFGFKPEEFILDFYDKYYPEDSKNCRHAFFLRLRR